VALPPQASACGGEHFLSGDTRHEPLPQFGEPAFTLGAPRGFDVGDRLGAVVLVQARKQYLSKSRAIALRQAKELRLETVV
jgi:hypothetical protein